ncbi:MAG: ribosome biogenesis GTPase YlqF [Chloroflexi bacterium]|nr:ribosome biogenesis GTPase YlqF [Chloroflexota bacterium]
MTGSWFPGHMQKAVRLLEESARHIDLLVIVLDARLPYTTRNMILEKTFKRPGKLFILNKADLADPEITEIWIRHIRKSGVQAFQAEEGSRASLKKHIFSAAQKRKSGSIFKVMVAGVPNVGKSSIINRLSKGARAKVADLPGTTRGKQWIRLDEGIALLDSPGVIPPAINNPEARWRLAACGGIPLADDLAHLTAAGLLEYLKTNYSGCAHLFPENFSEFAMANNFLKPGGEPDTVRAEAFFLKKYNDGALGRFSLETPESTGSLY